MEDFQNQKDVLHKLVAARDSIKQKYKLIKYNKVNTEKVFKDTFQPIVDPLQKIASDIDKKPLFNNSVKHHISFQPKVQTPKLDQSELSHRTFENNTSNSNTPKVNLNVSRINLPSFNHSTPKKSTYQFGENESMNFSKSDFDQTIIEQQLEPKVIANSSTDDDYVQLIKNKDTTLDLIYGVETKSNGELKIGNLPISFTNDEIIVGNKKYPRTIGLTELVILKRPSDSVTKNDNINYKNILEESKAHLTRDGKLRVHPTSAKFKDIIAPMFKYKGGGVLPKIARQKTLPLFKVAHKNPMLDYKYWDDPNELVDRLRLLIAE